MRRALSFLILMASVLSLSIGAQRSVPMYDPPPISVHDGATAEQVSKAIRAALVGRSWSISEETQPENEEPGRIVSTLHIRTHTVTINIGYDTSTIQISYVSSTGLGYQKTKKGERLIHPSYGKWIGNIERDLSILLLRME